MVELVGRLRPRPLRLHAGVRQDAVRLGCRLRPHLVRLGCHLRPHFPHLGCRLRAQFLALRARLRADPLTVAARLVPDLLGVGARPPADLLGIRATLLANRLEVFVDAIRPLLRLADHAGRLRVGITQHALGLGARLVADPLRLLVSRRPQPFDLGASGVEHGGGVALSRGAELCGLLLGGGAPLLSLALGLRSLLPRLREPAARVLLDCLEHPLALVEMVLDLPGGLVHAALGEPGAHPLQVLLDLVSVVPAPHLAEVSLDDEHGQRLGSSAHTRRASASLAGVLLRRPDEAEIASSLRAGVSRSRCCCRS